MTATSRNENELRPLVRQLPLEEGSLNLLERFLQENVPTIPCRDAVRRLRAINRLRQMFPAHVDKAKGAIDELHLLGIEYPVRDYGQAWNRVVESYAETTDQLLEAVRHLPPKL